MHSASPGNQSRTQPTFTGGVATANGRDKSIHSARPDLIGLTVGGLKKTVYRTRKIACFCHQVHPGRGISSG